MVGLRGRRRRRLQRGHGHLREDPRYASAILAPIEIFGVDAFKESEVIIKGRLKTVPMQQWTVGREYLRRLKKAFDARKIEIPRGARGARTRTATR